MASTVPKPIKQLAELLQEQQEPFKLDAYLHERGYLKKSFNSESSFSCFPRNSTKFQNRAASSRPNKTRREILHCSKILKPVINRLVSINDGLRKKNSDKEGENSRATERTENRDVEKDRFSSASSTTLFNSCSESDTEDFQALQLCSLQENAADTYREHQREYAEDSSKQLSPVSVLEDIPSDESSPLHKNTQPKTKKMLQQLKVKEEPLFTASLGELLLRASVKKPIRNEVADLQQLVGSNRSSQHSKSRRFLHQTRQLLFDCVREVMENHRRRNTRRRRHLGQFLGPEEIGKLVSAKIGTWGKQSGGRNIRQMLQLEFSASADEWKDFRPYTRELGMSIGDAIFEEIISELVTGLINY